MGVAVWEKWMGFLLSLASLWYFIYMQRYCAAFLSYEKFFIKKGSFDLI